ncbi:MAG: MMPL family transporter [Gammaproteobacteria bacterium]|nr:MMPL family transporter [Gammaproteobacteria bacterium]
MHKTISQQVAQFTVHRRLQLIAVSTLMMVLLGLGILRTSFDTSLNALLTESDPYLDELIALEEIFPSPTVVNFIFIAEDGETVFSRRVLDAIVDLQESYDTVPTATRLTSVLGFFNPETQQELFSQPLETYSTEELTRIGEAAVNERLLTANLLAGDGSLTFATITTNSDDSEAAERLEIAVAAEALLHHLRQENPDVDIYVNSEVLIEQSSQQAMVDDLTTLLPFVILACVIAICYCFKSATLGVCILTHTLYTIVGTVGTLGFIGYAFNSISIIAPLVVVIVSVANSVHIISIYKQELQRGSNKQDAMEYSLAHNFQPISLAAITTAIGFSSLNMCSSPAIQDFGQIVAIGILFAYILTLTLLPSLLIRFSRPMTNAQAGDTPFMHDNLQRLSEFTLRNDKAIFWSCSTLALITFLLLPLNETDFNRIDFIASDSDTRQYYDEVSEKMNRGPTLDYGIRTSSYEAAIEPTFLNRVDEFQQWVNEQTDVESAASLVDVVKTINRVSNNNDADQYVIPDDKLTITNHLLSYGFAQTEDFPLFGFVDQQFSVLNVFVNATPMTNQEMIDLDQRITDKFAEQFSDAELIHGSGILLFARMDELVTIELLQGYSISLLLITLSLAVGLRSIYFGILSVLPNLLPATMVFGMWGLFVGQLDPFVMMLFSISIGLVVDDTVHLLSHYLDGRRRGSDKHCAMTHAIKTAGPALTITTIVLALGTTVLIWANTLYFQQAAKLLVPIVVLALVLDLIYLPTILKRFDNKFSQKNPVTS